MDMLAAASEHTIADRKRLAEDYPQLLQRFNSPRPGDAQRLRSVMTAFRLTDEKVREHARAVKSVAEHQLSIEQNTETAAAVEARSKKLSALQTEIAQRREQLRQLETEFENLHGIGQGKDNMRRFFEREILMLRENHPLAFGVYDPATEQASEPKPRQVRIQREGMGGTADNNHPTPATQEIPA